MSTLINSNYIEAFDVGLKLLVGFKVDSLHFIWILTLFQQILNSSNYLRANSKLFSY